MKRKILFIIVAACTFSLCACNNIETKEENKETIYVEDPTISEEEMALIKELFEEIPDILEGNTGVKVHRSLEYMQETQSGIDIRMDANIDALVEVDKDTMHAVATKTSKTEQYAGIKEGPGYDIEKYAEVWIDKSTDDMNTYSRQADENGWVYEKFDSALDRIFASTEDIDSNLRGDMDTLKQIVDNPWILKKVNKPVFYFTEEHMGLVIEDSEDAYKIVAEVDPEKYIELIGDEDGFDDAANMYVGFTFDKKTKAATSIIIQYILGPTEYAEGLSVLYNDQFIVEFSIEEDVNISIPEDVLSSLKIAN